MVGMALERGVVHPLNGGVLFKTSSDGRSVAADDRHAHVQRTHSTLEKVACMWVRGGTKVHLLHEDLGDQIRAPDHRSTDDVAVPAQVFGGGMDDQVNPVVQRIAPPRAGKGAVNHGQQVVALRNRHHGRNVADLEHGVGQGLDVEHLRVGLDGRLIRGGVAHVRQRNLDTEAGQLTVQQAVGPAVDVRARHNVVPRVQQTEEHRRNGAHSARKNLGVLAAFHRAKFLCYSVAVDRRNA